jgi:hypothetical protein
MINNDNRLQDLVRHSFGILTNFITADEKYDEFPWVDSVKTMVFLSQHIASIKPAYGIGLDVK